MYLNQLILGIYVIGATISGVLAQDFPIACNDEDIPWNDEYCLEYVTGMNKNAFEADADCESRIKFLASVRSEDDEQDVEMYAKELFDCNYP